MRSVIRASMLAGALAATATGLSAARAPDKVKEREPDKVKKQEGTPSGAPSGKPVLLGRFEYALLGAVQILGADAYGAQIGRYLSEKLGRDVTAPQVYMTLERLAKRGFVRSENTNSVPARGGRSRKRFMLEADGLRALRDTSAAFNAVPTSDREGRNEINGPLDELECPA
jgi:PadR family transcriptional regulator, regulatory protein PadR